MLLEFIFVFIQYFNGAILMEKSCQKQGVWKKYKMGWDGHIYKGGRLSVERGGGGIQKFCTLWVWIDEKSRSTHWPLQCQWGVKILLNTNVKFLQWYGKMWLAFHKIYTTHVLVVFSNNLGTWNFILCFGMLVLTLNILLWFNRSKIWNQLNKTIVIPLDCNNATIDVNLLVIWTPRLLLLSLISKQWTT